MNLEIHVTKDDIANGKGFSSYDCPIATASKRALPQGCEINVYEERLIFWQPKNGMSVAELPPIAKRFIKRFDKSNSISRKLIKPFNFSIELKK